MKKIISVVIAAVMTLCLCGCGDDSKKNEKIYQDFKSYIAENGTEEDYYIQISKTNQSVYTLTEASRLGNDCAFMEYELGGQVRFYRNNILTVIANPSFYIPNKTDAQWEDFEFEGLNEKYRVIFEKLLESDAETVVEKTKNGSKEMPYSISVRLNSGELDTNEIFSNRGSFSAVNIKFDTDKKFEKFSNVTVACQYTYNNIVYAYSVTFGEPSGPDNDGNNGHRPGDIEKTFDSYDESVSVDATTLW